MKKILLVVAAMFCVATVSAQSKVSNFVEDAKWAIGLRAGGGVEVMAEGYYAKDRQVDVRLGWDWASGFGLTAIHAWNLKDWDWTPKVCWWFVDAGVGAYVGTHFNDITAGVAGSVKFGARFKKVPIRVAVDYTPKLGIRAGQGWTGFYGGFFNGGISASYFF